MVSALIFFIIFRVGEMRNPYKILVRKSEGKGPLERARGLWTGFS
jgi:hypothetical protein